jgi:hypothetical protein
VTLYSVHPYRDIAAECCLFIADTFAVISLFRRCYLAVISLFLRRPAGVKMPLFPKALTFIRRTAAPGGNSGV